jgi:cytochrome P450
MLVNKAFTPLSVERLRPRVRQIVNALLAGVEPRRHMEFIRDFAFPLPVIVISEYMGVPVEDREKVKEWADEISHFIFLWTNESGRRERAQKGLQNLLEYFEPLVYDRRRHPRDDLITALVQAEERGDLLSHEEVLEICTVLLFSGHETTTNLLANGLLAFTQHRDQWELLQRQPDLIRPAVEELLRYDGPIKTTTRWVRREVTMGGKTIKEGDMVMVALGSANRDPRKFANPDDLDITRTPNPHLAFGYGIHICLGAPMARLEAQEAFLALARRFPTIRLAVEPEGLEYHPTIIARALQALPVEW